MPFRTRRLLLLILPAGLVALAIAIWVLWPRTAINRENFEKIHRGMAVAEVEAILGGPPGDYGSGSEAPYNDLFIPSGNRLIAGEEWIGPEAVITVAFDQTGRVRNTQILERGGRDPLWTRFRHWLGL
jgi:hypothetical protein